MSRLSRFAVTCIAALTLCLAGPARGEEVALSSLQELAEYASQSGNTVTMEPGVYPLTDFISLDDIEQMRRDESWHFIDFSGSDNTFDLSGVTIEVDTALRAALRAPIHNAEFMISGRGNTFVGLKITNIGDGTSNQGGVLTVKGDDTTLRDCEFHVRGSSPYGYGDLFGKGDPNGVIPHRKHSGVQILGNNSRILGCRIFMRSYGHAFYIQGGTKHHFEDCYVEGVMRSTDDMLAETEGPAFEAGFRSVYRNRQGENRVTPGYMKSLSEDAYRTYGGIKDVTFINCTAKNMRAGFELRTHDGNVRIDNCTAIGNERGFWVAGGARITSSRGDAQYGPLLFLEGNNGSVELELLPAESDRNVHALATIHGRGHEVVFTESDEGTRTRPVPIRIGATQPGAGEGMSPYGRRDTHDVTLHNHTSMPVVLEEPASGNTVYSVGEVEDLGEDNTVERIER